MEVNTEAEGRLARARKTLLWEAFHHADFVEERLSLRPELATTLTAFEEAVRASIRS